MIIPLTKEELKDAINELENDIEKKCLHFERDLKELNILIIDFKKKLSV